MTYQGYVKLHRQIMDSEIWKDPFKYRLWNLCIMKATHTKKNQIVGNQVITLYPSQFITGRKALCEEYNKGVSEKHQLTESTIDRWLKLFEKDGMLSVVRTNKYSIITINNWSKYQEDERTTNEQQMNNKRTTNEQQMNTNKNEKNEENEENVLKEKITKKETYVSLIDSYTNNEELKIELKHYVDMRIKMKGFTVHALELKLKDLDKLAINESMKIEIVKQSIKKSWRGFFPLKNDSSGKKQSNDDLAF